MEQKIKNAKMANEAFVREFGSLARALNPAAPAYDGYNWVKTDIKIDDGEEIKAYIAHNRDCNTTFIVPVDGSTPTIEDFDKVEIIRKINSAKQAKDAFIAEYGSLARALNPAAPAYDGYVFVKQKIELNGDRFKAFIAHDTAKNHYFIVPVSGDKPSIEDFSAVKILE